MISDPSRERSRFPRNDTCTYLRRRSSTLVIGCLWAKRVRRKEEQKAEERLPPKEGERSDSEQVTWQVKSSELVGEEETKE